MVLWCYGTTPDGGGALGKLMQDMKPEDEPVGVLLGALDYHISNDAIQAYPMESLTR